MECINQSTINFAIMYYTISLGLTQRVQDPRPDGNDRDKRLVFQGLIQDPEHVISSASSVVSLQAANHSKFSILLFVCFFFYNCFQPLDKEMLLTSYL